MNIHSWFPLESTGLIFLLSKGLLHVFSSTTDKKASIFRHSAFFKVQLSHLYTTIGKIIHLTLHTFVEKVMPLLFNMLSRFVITFLPRSRHLLISWLQSPSSVILDPRKIKFATVSTFCLSTCDEVMGPVVVILVFWMLSTKPAFSLSSFTFIRRYFIFSSSFLSFGWCHLHILGYWYFCYSWYQLVIHQAWHFSWHTLHIS